MIKAEEIERKFPGTGRYIGKKLAEIVHPGDTVDFKDFVTISNGFADEFVKNFAEKWGKEAFKSLKFINTPDLLLTLFEVALHRLEERNNKHTASSRKQVRTVSSFADPSKLQL